MTQTVNVNFRMDSDVKQRMEEVCSEMGLTLTTAFTMFAKKVISERRIPFEVTADPFYSEKNINYLKGIISDIESGKAKFVEKTLDDLEDLASEKNNI